jgi:sigma-B regulation protein RsbU (phosphoserine phosphatase)
MAKLQATIRAIVQDYRSLFKLGKKLNEIFYRDSIPKIFASLIYAELNSESGEVRMLNAGHLPPIKISVNNIEHLKKDSPALGLLNDAEYYEHSITLNVGDYLLIYSDGVTEAQNESGEFFGEERLIGLIVNDSPENSRQLGKNILNSINSFVDKAPIHDDLTMAIIRRTK